MTEKDVVVKIYAAINRNDLSALIELFDPQISRIEPAGFPSSGTYRGRTEVIANISKGRSTWAEGACEPEQFEIAGEVVIAFSRVHVRLKDSQDWIDARIADVFTFQNGKVTGMHTFGSNEEAIEWVKKTSDSTNE